MNIFFVTLQLLYCAYILFFIIRGCISNFRRRKQIRSTQEYMHWGKCGFYYGTRNMAIIYILSNCSGIILLTQSEQATLQDLTVNIIIILAFIVYLMVSKRIMKKRCRNLTGKEGDVKLYDNVISTGLAVYAAIVLFPFTLFYEFFRSIKINFKTVGQVEHIDYSNNKTYYTDDVDVRSEAERKSEKRSWDGF